MLHGAKVWMQLPTVRPGPVWGPLTESVHVKSPTSSQTLQTNGSESALKAPSLRAQNPISNNIPANEI